MKKKRFTLVEMLAVIVVGSTCQVMVYKCNSTSYPCPYYTCKSSSHRLEGTTCYY